MVEKKEEEKTFNFSNILIVSVLIIFTSLLLLGSKTSFEGDFECSTGFIGVDLETKGYIQNKTCEDSNLTCFKQDLLTQHMNIKNIDDMRCSGSGKVSGNVLMFLLGDITNG